MRSSYSVREVGELGKKPVLDCKIHGMQPFYRENTKGYGRYRCARCNADAILARKRKLKAELIAEAGGKCSRCPYDKDCPGAYHFHHREPDQKTFNLAQMTSFSKAKVREEATKCDLLCSNCHAEVEEELRGPLA